MIRMHRPAKAYHGSGRATRSPVGTSSPCHGSPAYSPVTAVQWCGGEQPSQIVGVTNGNSDGVSWSEDGAPTGVPGTGVK